MTREDRFLYTYISEVLFGQSYSQTLYLRKNLTIADFGMFVATMAGIMKYFDEENSAVTNLVHTLWFGWTEKTKPILTVLALEGKRLFGRCLTFSDFV